jgi:hypothetical protein
MDQYQQLIFNQLVEYNLSLIVKEQYVVKLTYCTIIESSKENFLVWIKKIDNIYITGIVLNNLQTKEFEIGDEIVFSNKHIQEISNTSYKLDTISLSIQKTKNNALAIYFRSLNNQFI